MKQKNEGKAISQAIIKRLPRYYRYLGELKASNVERISSSDLSKMMNVTASQIRQDLNNFGGFGQQGYGYNVDYLYNEIGKILGIDKVHNCIIIGAGNLGTALAGYKSFYRYGFNIMAMFDKEANKIGTVIRDLPVKDIEEVKEFIKDNNIEIVIMTLPKDSAKEVVSILCDTDIKGIWNFAHTDLDVPSTIEVQNVHLSESLMRLSYNMANSGGMKMF